MRVLFFMPSLTLGKGGAEAVCANVANYLVLAGQDVAIVSTNSMIKLPEFILIGLILIKTSSLRI